MTEFKEMYVYSKETGQLFHASNQGNGTWRLRDANGWLHTKKIVTSEELVTNFTFKKRVR